MPSLRPVAVLLALVLATSAAAARVRRPPPDPSPFAHAPCSVFDNRPCTPSVCSPLERGPCSPEMDYPIGQDLHLTVLSVPDEQDAAKYRRPDHALDTISDLFAMLRSCWAPPDGDAAQPGMQLAVRFSLRRDGSLIAPPRVTYATPKSPASARERYREAVTHSLDGCAPLPLSKGLGGAVAGRPIMVRYVDNRDTASRGEGEEPPTKGEPAQP